MPRAVPKSSPSAQPGPTVTKAILRAAERLAISNKVIAATLGLSEATVSRMGNGGEELRLGDKPFELSLLLVRLYRSLDAITGGDDAVARAWLRNDNDALGDAPLKLVQTVPGLVNVIAYLDARRAIV
jgi:hypothetical protein